jgi:MFS family permease
MYGKRRVIIGALVGLTIGCLLAAMATNVFVLIIGRGLQGCGIGVLPLAMAVAKESLAPEKTTRGVALVSATLGVGGGLGLPMSGVLLGWFGWQSVFWVAAALSVVALVLTVVVLPDVRSRDTRPFDVLGAVWLGACLVALLLPLSKSAEWGWVEPLPLTIYLAGLVGLVGWYRYERRPARPLVDVALMRERPLMLVNSAGLLMGFAMFANLYTSIVLLQMPDSVSYGFGTSVVAAGLLMLPGALAMMAMSPVCAWITERFGGRTALWLGAAVMGAGYATRPLMIGSVGAIAISVAIVNAGVGISYGAMPTVTMAYVPPSETGSANAIGTLTRASGASLSSAAVAAILASMTLGVGGSELATLTAFHVIFALAATASFAAALVAYQLPRNAASSDGATAAATTARVSVSA